MGPTGGRQGEGRYLCRDGTWLHSVEGGSGPGSLVFIHGLGGSHRNFAPQMQHFSSAYHVVAVDLRGHGASQGPMPADAIAACADDVAWQCREMGLGRPVLVGHSAGGHVAAQIAEAYPELPAAVVFLDSSLVFGPDRLPSVRAMVDRFHGPEHREAVRTFAQGLFAPEDDPDRRNRIAEEMAALPQPVLTALASSLVAWRADEVLAGCALPLLYIGSRGRPELDELRGTCPNFEYGQVVGTGHFLQLEVPDQVNAMIDRFLRTHGLPER